MGGLPPRNVTGFSQQRISNYGDIFAEQLGVTLSLNTDTSNKLFYLSYWWLTFLGEQYIGLLILS